MKWWLGKIIHFRMKYFEYVFWELRLKKKTFLRAKNGTVYINALNMFFHCYLSSRARSRAMLTVCLVIGDGFFLCVQKLKWVHLSVYCLLDIYFISYRLTNWRDDFRSAYSSSLPLIYHQIGTGKNNKFPRRFNVLAKAWCSDTRQCSCTCLLYRPYPQHLKLFIKA